MPGKLIITRGLSGSGKTTWAKGFCGWEPDRRFRVNRDDLRSMLFGGYRQGYEFEQAVTAIQQNAVRELLRKDKTVVVDDTLLALRHAKAFAKLAHEEGASFEVNDEFLSVSVAECLRRDEGRDVLKRVGRKVIMNQWDRVGDDKPNKPVVQLVEWIFDYSKLAYEYATPASCPDGLKIIFMSGRSAVCRTETERWLAGEGFWDFELFMRPEGDNRKDSEIKLELFNAHVRDKYNVQLVLDDRNQVVQLWRNLGLTCLQVADGDF